MLVPFRSGLPITRIEVPKYAAAADSEAAGDALSGHREIGFIALDRWAGIARRVWVITCGTPSYLRPHNLWGLLPARQSISAGRTASYSIALEHCRHGLSA